jgi:hypothetical protein
MDEHTLCAAARRNALAAIPRLAALLPA